MADIKGTLSERGNRYGDFSHHAEIAQRLQDDMRCYDGWHHLDAVKKQALTVIADKIARILSGDPEYADNWHDIQGYARLVEDRLGDDKSTGDLFEEKGNDSSGPERVREKLLAETIYRPDGKGGMVGLMPGFGAGASK